MPLILLFNQQTGAKMSPARGSPIVVLRLAMAELLLTHHHIHHAPVGAMDQDIPLLCLGCFAQTEQWTEKGAQNLVKMCLSRYSNPCAKKKVL